MIVFIRYDLLAHDSFRCTTACRRLNIILYLYVLDYYVCVYGCVLCIILNYSLCTYFEKNICIIYYTKVMFRLLTMRLNMIYMYIIIH